MLNFNVSMTQMDEEIKVQVEKENAPIALKNVQQVVRETKKLSEMESDSEHRTVTDKEKENWNAKSDFSGKYNDLEDKPDIPKVPDWSMQQKKPTYTADEVGARSVEWMPSYEDVGADEKGTATVEISDHNTSDKAHNDIRLLLKSLTERLNDLADSDDNTLDQMSEVVSYIKSNKSLIDAITTSKVSVSDVINNLTTNTANKPLSAAQGMNLKKLIDAILIPEKLPNPNKIFFNGSVSAEYDGSSEVVVTFPDDKIERIVIPSTGGSLIVEFEPNKLYILPELTSLTYALELPTDNSVASEYHFFFSTPITGGVPKVTHPNSVRLPPNLKIGNGLTYEFSILENCLSYKEFGESV